MNKIILLGYLGQLPDLKYGQSGAAVCTLRLATNEHWTDKSGNQQERTTWHRIVVFGKQAEVCKKYLEKGRQILIEGKLQNRSYEDKDGVKRFLSEVVASHVEFLGKAPSAQDSEEELPPQTDKEVPF